MMMVGGCIIPTPPLTLESFYIDQVHRHSGLQFNPLLHASSIREEMERQRRQQQQYGGQMPAEDNLGAAAAPFTPFRQVSDIR